VRFWENESIAASVYLYINLDINLAACFRGKKLSDKHCLQLSKTAGIHH
jgi:hypothetical protein